MMMMMMIFVEWDIFYSLTYCADMKLETHPHALHRVEVEQYIDPSADWQTGFWMQYSTLTRRTFICQMGRYFSKFFLGKLLFLCFITGIVWFGMKRTEDMARNRLGMVLTQL